MYVAMVRLATDGSLAPSDLDYTWTTTGADMSILPRYSPWIAAEP